MGLFSGPKVTPENEQSQALKKLVYNTGQLTEDQSASVSKLFGDLLSAGADPSRVALDATILGNQFPNLGDFRPGGSIYNRLVKASYLPETRKQTLDTANKNYLSVLGRTMTDQEKSYVDKERPSEQQLISMLYANPASNFAQAETPEEQQVSSYYGRMIPRKDPETGAVGFTGERYGLKVKNPVVFNEYMS
jgi:hypothetical protein